MTLPVSAPPPGAPAATPRRPMLLAALAGAPATLPSAVAMALFVVWATAQAGYPLTHWAPGALVVLALLAMTAWILGPPRPRPARATIVALACLGAFTALSFLSIAWAGVPGDAWEGANRTLLYLLVFALFACWPQRGATAAALIAGWTLAIAGLGVEVLVHLGSVSGARLPALFPGGRLTYPSGYANANAAQWLIAFWPAVLLACSRRIPWLLRGLLAAGAVVLAGVALLSQSRGSLYSTPVMLVLVFALLPGRVRRLVFMAPVAAGIAAFASPVLRVGNHLSDGNAVAGHLHTALAAVGIAAIVCGAVVAAMAALDARGALAPASRARVRRVLGVAALVLLAGAIVAGLAAGHPVRRAEHAWNTFKSGKGYGANGSGGRLTSGLGSQRYDFYRVSLDEFLHHPVAGVGVDNFQQQYLLHGRSQETPRYPHSVEMRTLAETGVIGAVLAIAGLAAALLAAGRAIVSRRSRAGPLARDVAVAALGGFAYWAVHGSFDWFFEFAGLGAPAFALLGIACALGARAPALVARVPRTSVAAPVTARSAVTAVTRRRALAVATVVGVLAAGASLALPWLSGLEIDEAAGIWRTAPLTSYSALEEAADLDPLSDEPYLLAGSIALRYGDLDRAERYFLAASRRVPGGAYARLELGAIASTRGQRQRALAYLGSAERLDPRSGLIASAAGMVHAGGVLRVDELTRALLNEAQQLR